MASLRVNLNTDTFQETGMYPLVIELFHNGKMIKISTPYSLSEKNFNPFQEKAVVNEKSTLSKERSVEINKYLFQELSNLVKIIRRFDVDIISRIEGVDPGADRNLSVSRDLFLFTYYAGGMSFPSIACLKKSDMHEGLIWFRRNNRYKKQIGVKITPAMRKLIL